MKRPMMCAISLLLMLGSGEAATPSPHGWLSELHLTPRTRMQLEGWIPRTPRAITEDTGSRTPNQTPLPSSPFTPADRTNLSLLWPVETRTVSSPPGPRKRTRYVFKKRKGSKRLRRVKQQFTAIHRGVDLNAPMGSDVYAALDGRVSAEGFDPLLGNYLRVDHGNGVLTLYGHHSRNLAQVGDVVTRGQKIAEVGSTGRSTGPHLHFELRIDGVPHNPLKVLDRTVTETPLD